MSKSLLLIPDISGYTNFIQTTEIEHSQHVIAELLEILIEAEDSGFELAEVEGDALFFYIPDRLIKPNILLNQIEKMFTVFYSHLKLLENNRICPCNACASAPKLELKIIAHCGEIRFINIQNTTKPFGTSVIEVHRLLKNSVNSNNYTLISEDLIQEIGLTENNNAKLFNFRTGKDVYDGKNINYIFSEIDPQYLSLTPLEPIRKVKFDRPPNLVFKMLFPVKAETILEYISNYKFRKFWTKAIDDVSFNRDEVTRLGTEHKCIIKGSELDFKTVTKDGDPDAFIYGEYTDSPPPIDELYQFYTIKPLDDHSSQMRLELYWITHSWLKKLFMRSIGKRLFKNNISKTLDGLSSFISSTQKTN